MIQSSSSLATHDRHGDDRESTETQGPWRDQLDIVRRSIETRSGVRGAQSGETRWAPPAQILYAVNLEHSLRTGGLIVDFLQRQQNKSGELGRLKTLSMDDDRLGQIQGEDRKHLSILMASPVDAKTTSTGSGGSEGTTLRIRRGTVPPALYPLVLPSLCATGRLIWLRNRDQDPDPNRPIHWDEGPPLKLGLRLEADEAARIARMHGELYREGELFDVETPLLNLSSGLALFADRIVGLATGALFSWTVVLRTEGPVEIPMDLLPEALEELWRHPELPRLTLPDEHRVPEIELPPRPHLTILSPHPQRSLGASRATLAFDYEGLSVETNDTRGALLDREGRRLLIRDRTRESAALKTLTKLGFRPNRDRRDPADFMLPTRLLSQALEHLLNEGWLLRAEGNTLRRPGRLSFGITTGIDWFELEGTASFEGRDVPIPAILRALEQQERFVVLDDGSLGMLPEEWLRRLARLQELSIDGTAEDELHFQPSQALLLESLLDSLLADSEEISTDSGYRQLREKLTQSASMAPIEEPVGFVGELRAYQKIGLGWLDFLATLGLGGCLADDMGLGKTIQVLALLQRLNRQQSEESQGSSPALPSVVVAPRSLVYNWAEEASRFTPDLRVRTYLGADRRKDAERFSGTDLVITTYGTLRRDILSLRDQPFEYVILDEAQAIKNASSQTAKATRLLQAKHRLALTGTPIENHLGELWSIFEFLNPGMLGRVPKLEELVDAHSTDSDQKPELRRALSPFILRRTKSEVLSELPPKTEQVLRCQLGKGERALYDELRQHYRSSLVQRVDSVGLNRSKIQVLEALLRLRQAACHPGLLDSERVAEPSTKIDLLIQQLEEVLSGGHKALVFSQFTSLLSIVRQRLEAAGIVYEYLDGKTRDRGARVDRFQDDPDCPVFLISLKAGGVGLNLTAASYVYLLDPWWNPAVEAQAIDRAHRIGQDQPVFAYRLIAEDTVEEKILQLQDSKRELAEAILQADGSVVKQLSTDDLLWLLE